MRSLRAASLRSLRLNSVGIFYRKVRKVKNAKCAKANKIKTNTKLSICIYPRANITNMAIKPMLITATASILAGDSLGPFIIALLFLVSNKGGVISNVTSYTIFNKSYIIHT